MKANWSTVAVATLFTIGLGGCAVGQAKVWSQDQQGGILALEGDEGKAMEDAERQMSLHCGQGNYRIVKRYHVKVGSEQYSNSATDYDERTDRARDEDTAAVAVSDTVHSSDTTTESDAYGSDTMHDSQTSTAAAAASSTSEDETSLTEGGSRTSSVQGVRDVNSFRIQYECGGGMMAPAPAAPAPVQQ